VNGFDWPYTANAAQSRACLTIFSSPNYCEQHNQAAVLLANADGTLKLDQFDALPIDRQAKRRILLPKWLIEDVALVNLDDEAGSDTEPNTPRVDHIEVTLLP
jgi:hypothetical protein